MSAVMDDPFTTPQRTSVQDSNSNPIVLPTSSPSQIKRTLEAHLAEVNKRIETAGSLGRALLSQQQEYEARIKELDDAGDTVDPELKKKLQDLEKEYNEVGRESARAVLTNKIMGGGTSPYGAGNLVPSASANLQAQGTNSPSKLSVPSRRQRNQPSRQHDLEFAAELGQGLLVEVRRLQALLSEREEALRVLQIERAGLEQQAELLESRVRSFDDNEQRYKEENWDLELRNQELLAQVREQQEIEDRLHAEIQRLCHEKEDIIKELDEWKHQNEKLFEDLEAEHKHHEVEFATMRRNLATNENERIALEKKVEDLKQELEDSHNQSSRLRASLEHREDNEQNEDPFVTEPAQTPPENSPPTSPTKPTPRNTHLEAETLKSSLQHAHRYIANLKSNMNRERTEKAELRRLLQEARDDLENSRLRRDSVGGPPNSADKRRKGKASFIKSGAPRPIFNTTLLGGARRTKDEVIKNTQVDEEWEEEPEDEPPSPTRIKAPLNSVVLTDYTLSPPGGEADESEFETANEAAGMTTDAFETANEHDSTATETEAYRTGNESPVYDHPTSADELTETEPDAHLRVKKKTSRASSFGGSRRPVNRTRHRDSVVSSASTEEDSDGTYEDRRNRHDDFMTPVPGSGQRLRSKMGRPHSRGSQGSMFRNRERAFSAGSSNRDRTFSASSSDAGTFQFHNGSPSSVRHRRSGAGERKSLFAELGDGMFNGGDDDEDTAEEDEAPVTPTRSKMPYVTKGVMVDCGIMTDDLLDYPALDRSRNFLGANDMDRPRTAFSTISSMHTIEERETTNDIGVQSEDAEVIEIGTQFDPTPVIEMGTQSDIPYPTHPDLSKELQETEEELKATSAKLLVVEGAAAAAAAKLLEADEASKVAAAKLLKSDEAGKVAAEKLIKADEEAKLAAKKILQFNESEMAAAAKLLAAEEEVQNTATRLAASEEEARNTANRLAASEEFSRATAARLAASEKEVAAAAKRLAASEEDGRVSAAKLAAAAVAGAIAAEALRTAQDSSKVTEEKLRQVEEDARLAAERLAKEEENSKSISERLAQEEENVRITAAKLAQEEENMRVISAKLAKEEENAGMIVARLAQEEENVRSTAAKLAQEEKNFRSMAEKLAQEEKHGRATAVKLRLAEKEMKATAARLAKSEEEARATAERLAASQEELRATAEGLAASQEEARVTDERLMASQEESRVTAERLAAAEEESRATAKRLAVSEQEVRTTAERLAASEDETRTTAKRLSAAEEEVRTTAERLTASKEEVRIMAERLAASEEEVKATAARLAASEEEARTTAARLAESEEESRVVAAKLAAAEEDGIVSAAKLVAAAAAGALTADRLRAAQDSGKETERKLREAEEDAREAKELAQKNEQDFTKAMEGVNTLKPIIVKLEEEIASLKVERDGFKETASTLPAAQDLAQKNEASFIKAQGEIDTLKPIISSLEAQIKNLKFEHDNLQNTELPAAKAMAQKNEASFVRAQEEINTLKPIIVKLEEEIVVLKVERQTLQETASTIPAAKEMAKKNEENYAKALREVNTLKPIIAQLEEEVKSLKEERDDLQENALPAAKEMAQKNLEEVNTLKPIIVRLEEDIKALKVERDDLQDNTLPAAQQLAQKKEAEINTLKPIITRLEGDIEALMVERDGFQVTASALPAAQALVREKEDDINTLKPIIAKLEEDVETLKVERDSFQVTASALPAAKELAEKKEAEINTLKPIITQLEGEVKALKPIIVNLKQELSTVKVERDGLKENALPAAEKLAQKNEANFLKTLEEVNTLKPIIIKLEEEVKSLAVERNELQGTALPAAQQMAQKNLDEVNTLKPIVARLEEEVSALKVERDGLREIASALPAAKEMAQEKEAEVNSLRPIITQLEQEIMSLKPVIIKLEEEVKSLTEERDDLQENALPAMKQIAEKSEADFVKTLEEVNTLKPIIAKLDEELVNVKQERDGLQEALPVAKEMAQKNEAEVNSLKPIIVKLEQEVKTLTVERDNLKETVPVMKEMAQKNQDNFAMALEEVNTLKPIVAKLEEELATMQKERDTLKETLPVAQQLAEKNEADFVKARGEVDTLKPIISQLEQEVGTLKPIVEKLEEEVIILKAERDDLQDTALPAAQQMAQMNLEEVNTLRPAVAKLENEVGTLKPVIVKLEEEIAALREERDVLQETVSAIPVLDMRDTGVQPDPEPISFAGTQTEPETEEYSVVFDKVAEFEPALEAPLEFSGISVQDTTPIELVEKSMLPTPVPISASTARDASVSSDEETPKKVSETVEEQQQRPTTPSPQKSSSIFGSMFGGWKRPSTPAQEPEGLKGANERIFSTGTFGTGIKEIPIIKAPAVDQEAQTDITQEFFDNMAVARTVDKGKRPAFAVNTPDSMYLGTDRSRARSPSLRSHESHDSFGLNGARGGAMKRPGSSGSLRGAVGSMGPPPLPSSSRNNVSFRPKTPVNTDTIKAIGPETPNSKAGTTPRPNATPRFSATRSEVSSPTSRRSSISSFASELDTRFNIMPEAVAGEAQTDPRMIQAITQTMIGEYLWKYTRNAGRGSLSHSRHKRFFWVHPYTRTLYWSERDPTTAGRAELRAKSVAIEAVRVVTDDNPMPPGLHRKSLVVITPGRSLKFTAPTGQRHETWFNALSYLLLRTGGELGEEGVGEPVNNPEDGQFHSNFNNGNGNGAPGSIRGGAAESLSSYNTRTTRASSPARNNSSLSNSRPSDKVARQGSRARLSNLFRPTSGFGTFSTRSSKHNPSIYDQSELNDSAEDLREQIENEDSEKLENVRACCDGKHDVGTLPRRGGRKTQSIRSKGTDHHNHHHTDAASERAHSHV